MAQATVTKGPLDRGVAKPGKLGLGALTALVVGSMIGAGVFSLPQNMATSAAPVAILIGWLFTGIGFTYSDYETSCDLWRPRFKDRPLYVLPLFEPAP